MELALDGPITPVLNHEILEEYRQVLLRPKFHLTARIVGDLLDNIIARAVFADAHKLMLELPDPKDVEMCIRDRTSAAPMSGFKPKYAPTATPMRCV